MENGFFEKTYLKKLFVNETYSNDYEPNENYFSSKTPENAINHALVTRTSLR